MSLTQSLFHRKTAMNHSTTAAAIAAVMLFEPGLIGQGRTAKFEITPQVQRELDAWKKKIQAEEAAEGPPSIDSICVLSTTLPTTFIANTTISN